MFLDTRWITCYECVEGYGGIGYGVEWSGADLNWGKIPTKTFNETGGENKLTLTYNSMYKNICNNQKPKCQHLPTNQPLFFLTKSKSLI